MRITHRIASAVAGGLLIAGVSLALAPAATAAPTTHHVSTVQAQPKAAAKVVRSLHATAATLVANGAAVDVVFNLTADPGKLVYVSFGVSEVVEGFVSTGYGNGQITALGKPQKVTLRAVVSGGLRAMRPGLVVVQGGLGNVDGTATWLQLDQTLKITG